VRRHVLAVDRVNRAFRFETTGSATSCAKELFTTTGLLASSIVGPGTVVKPVVCFPESVPRERSWLSGRPQPAAHSRLRDPIDQLVHEAEAEAAQKVRWDVCRRMLRAAVEGDETLQKLWAEC
jgi:hypothetical protein